MTDGDDLIVSAVLMDNLIFADGTERPNVPGGAGLYALAGAALFSERAMLVAGTGTDFPHTFAPWMERNGLATEGLRFDDAHAPRNVLRYIDDHTRTETPVYGAAHFARLEPRPSDVARFIGRARSIYIFRNLDAAFWHGIDTMVFPQRPLIFWEIALDVCDPKNRTAIESRLERVDALSINYAEASAIFGSSDEADIIAGLSDWPVATVFLRLGARGSMVVGQGGAQFVPSLPVDPVDVTGGGNAYGGAAMIGLALGYSQREAAAMGTVAASFAIGQFGPPESGTQPVRNLARERVQTLLQEMEAAVAP
ncbi:carbohydrate kinase family protein [Pelagibacterium halotolerans]|uniref:Carbohydrate kinase, PfkB family n=1 Tax=Pelagibacterium halotolerans (strain DSM 22347 / JCM 15775 / CGMCC 1.7692 / B2) TaxID=1082931 RepID=G4REL2_PELHB|nr:PfkB family carbohydrate kinase [Pelagibacterium halotolerans]AEQ50862.1 carbohydrate kinase, PfkB family [Pelagibacterium halotolerans B2]QJR19228.1 hypothetical protein HKM20_12740 [Pelagibacterium halotolerans]SDZ98261.1 Sugar or nucleoside kinase, ribokinase family [Pelagibacterium halotolerans]